MIEMEINAMMKLLLLLLLQLLLSSRARATARAMARATAMAMVTARARARAMATSRVKAVAAATTTMTTAAATPPPGGKLPRWRRPWLRPLLSRMATDADLLALCDVSVAPVGYYTRLMCNSGEMLKKSVFQKPIKYQDNPAGKNYKT